MRPWAAPGSRGMHASRELGVRGFQRDPDAPQGDPEVAWASPFFVDYQ